MYTREQVSRQRQAFWTTFGQYMQPILSADGIKTHWINYKTGVAGINFKMEATNDHADIAIVFSHSDQHIRQAHYSQLLQLRSVLHNTLGEEWKWEEETADDYGKPISRVGITMNNVNISRSEDWPALISFFKPRIVALDEFWSMAKDGFEA
jgi:hypothetical protein